MTFLIDIVFTVYTLKQQRLNELDLLENVVS